MDYKDEMRIDNFTWNYMINAGYREVGEDEIVIKKSEYETLKAQNDTLELAVKDLRYRNAQFSEANKLFAKRNDELLDELQGATAIKEKTAREILQEVVNAWNTGNLNQRELAYICSRYGIKLEDRHE